MNEMLKVAVESRDSLKKYLADIEQVFESEIPGKDSDDISAMYSNMYGAMEECLHAQEQVIESLEIEVADGRTVGDVFDDILEHNERMEVFSAKFEKAEKSLKSHVNDVSKMFMKAE